MYCVRGEKHKKTIINRSYRKIYKSSELSYMLIITSYILENTSFVKERKNRRYLGKKLN